MANADTSNGCENGGSGGGARPPRLPRWTRQEILVLIQGKKVAESRGSGRLGIRAHHIGSSMGSGHRMEPKWVLVSSYCRRHGVNRGPVQCRKRWSNLAGDYKKVKVWECRRKPDGGEESFWVMRTDLRRERNLPGFFDREVYDMLDGAAEVEVDEEVKPTQQRGGVEPDEVLFDSARTAGDDGLFSDFEQEQEQEQEEEGDFHFEEEEKPVAAMAVAPISEKKFQPSDHGCSDPGTTNGNQQTENPEKGSTSWEGQKRRRASPEGAGDTDLMNRLIEVLDCNSRMLTRQLEAQNISSQLDREQRKDHTNNLIGVLGKFADALGKIADKL